MQKRSLLAIIFVGLSLSFVAAGAQDIPAATRGDLEVGGTISIANPALSGLILGGNGQYFSTEDIIGGSAYFNFNVLPKIGLVAELNYPDYHTPRDFLEKSYMVGVRYLYPVGYRYVPYAKAMVGLGSTSYDKPVNYITVPGTPGSYTVLAFGGGLDVRLNHKLVVRAFDFEYQDWLSFPDANASGPSGSSIHPYILSIGIAYRVR